MSSPDRVVTAPYLSRAHRVIFVPRRLAPGLLSFLRASGVQAAQCGGSLPPPDVITLGAGTDLNRVEALLREWQEIGAATPADPPRYDPVRGGGAPAAECGGAQGGDSLQPPPVSVDHDCAGQPLPAL